MMKTISIVFCIYVTNLQQEFIEVTILFILCTLGVLLSELSINSLHLS